MKLSKTEPTLAQAAAKAGMDEKTARKWRRKGVAPSEARPARAYRTRADPFAEVWGEVEAILERDASVEGAALFEYLSRRHPGRFQGAQVRTLQRRLKAWRAQHGPPREVYFAQEHPPGRQAQSDFTAMGELGVTVAGQPFAHLLYHFTLTYSNWEWVMVCPSESYESLAEGLQGALWALGGVPREHRTDSLSAAVKQVESRAEFTARYQGLLDHYHLAATHTSPGRGHENGDVEQAHRRFKRAAAQELLLRGSRDFASRAAYEAFLEELVRRRNRLRQARLGEEVRRLGPLPARRLESCTFERHRVTKYATIQVRQNCYSVPSQLIGEWVEARVEGEAIEVWFAGRRVERMERLRGKGQAAINYRHLIHSLVRKPGAFAHYRHRQALFPRLIFRVAWDELQRTAGARAEGEYLALLLEAAEGSEELVAQALRELTERGEEITAARVREVAAALGQAAWSPVLRVAVAPVALGGYDALLGGEVAR